MKRVGVVTPVKACEKCGSDLVDRVLSIFQDCETGKYIWLPVDTCNSCGEQVIRDGVKP